MPKENYTISAFHGGLNSSSDPRDIKNEDLSVASGVDVSNVGKVVVMNGEEPHFSTGISTESRIDRFSEVQPGYGLFSYKTDALGTSSQSNNYLRSEQLQYGSAGSNSTGSIVFILNELNEGGNAITYKLYFNNSAIESGVATATDINGVYYIPLSGSNVISRGQSTQDIANNLTNSINNYTNTDIGSEFSAIRIGNEVRIQANSQTSDSNGTLILRATYGDVLNIEYNISNMSGGLTAQKQKTRFIFPSDTVSAVTYFITLNNSDRYTLTGHADDKIFHIVSRFIHANGTSDTSSDSTHPVYNNGSLSASASQNTLKLNGSDNTAGIDGNSDYSVSFELEPNTTQNQSLIPNYNFGDGSSGSNATDWTLSQFTITGRDSDPKALFGNSGDGSLINSAFGIDANTLYQLQFTIATASLELTITDSGGTNGYVPEVTYAAGTHTMWIYQTVSRTGIKFSCEDDGSGAGTITDIKLQKVLPSFIVESATNTNYLVEAGIEQTEGYIGNRWLALCDRNSHVHLYSNTGGTWNTPISLGTGTNAKGAFYFVDGALRVCDSNHKEATESTPHNSTNKPKWYGYIDRYFYGTSAAGYGTRSQYYINRFVSADVGLNALDVIATNIGSTATQTTAAKPINLQFTQTGESSSTWAVGANTTYEIAVTTLYDDSKQESALDIPDTNPTVEITDANKLKVKISLWADNSTGLYLKYPRVSGFHIYMREEGRTDWFLQWEVDIEKGIRAYKTGDYTAFINGTLLTTQANCESAYLLDPRQIETYEIMTSRDQSYSSVSLDTTGNCWRSALVANRRAWIAAPTMQDELGNTITKGDTMIKSNVNQFDSFTLDNRVDVAIRDGEDIVAIAEFGDRILQFKQQTLYIINISQDFEFLEATYKNRGIVNHNAQCRTDYGVAWVNRTGCYLFDGKRVNNLLEKNNLNIIDKTTWSDFINKNSIIGYAAKDKQLIVLNSPIVSPNDRSPNNIFVYDLVIGSWTRGYDKWTNQNKTNFLTDWEDSLIIGHNPVGLIKSWGKSFQEKTFDLVTKDIDFSKPAIRKKFYKLYITYKCPSENTNIRVQFSVNGISTFYNFLVVDNATLDGDYATLDGFKSNWTTAILKPQSRYSNNIYSVKIKLYNDSTSGYVPSDFEVNDISLIHRRKPIK